jgi:hypothetical protein
VDGEPGPGVAGESDHPPQFGIVVEADPAVRATVRLPTWCAGPASDRTGGVPLGAEGGARGRDEQGPDLATGEAQAAVLAAVHEELDRRAGLDHRLVDPCPDEHRVDVDAGRGPTSWLTRR